MKRTVLFLAVVGFFCEARLFAATITLSNKDPRVNNTTFIERD